MIKIGTKVKIVSGPASIKGKTGVVGEIRHGLYKGASKMYTIDLTGGSSIQLRKEDIRQLKESEQQRDNQHSLLEQVITELSPRTLDSYIAKSRHQLKKLAHAGYKSRVAGDIESADQYDRKYVRREQGAFNARMRNPIRSKQESSGYTENDSSKEYYDDFDEWAAECRRCGCSIKHDPHRGVFIAIDRAGNIQAKWTKHNGEGYVKCSEMTEDSTRGQYRQHYNDANRYSRARQDAEIDRTPQQNTRWSDDPIAAATDRLHSLFSKKRVEEDRDPNEQDDDIQRSNDQQMQQPAPQQSPEQRHIVGVMIVDKDSSMVTKRDNEEGSIQRRIKVGGSTEQEAIARARAHYKKHGYKVLDVWYIKPLSDREERKTGDNRTQQFRGTGGLPPTDDRGNKL